MAPGDHFDIALSKRALAVEAGAIEISWRQCGVMTMRRRATGQLGDPAMRWNGRVKGAPERWHSFGPCQAGITDVWPALDKRVVSCNLDLMSKKTSKTDAVPVVTKINH